MLDQALISVAGIALVVGLAWFLLGRTRRRPLTEQEALEAARGALPFYRPVRAICGQDGRGALAIDADGQIAILKPHGDHLSARLLPPGTSAHAEAGCLIVRTNEAMFGEVRLDLGAAAGEWLQMIEGAR